MDQPHKDENGNDVPCDYTFEYWTKNDPQKLLKYIETSDSPGHITFATEYAGNIKEAKDILLKCLNDQRSPLIREGALYGLEIYRHEYFEHWYEITEEIERHTDEKIETSPGVRVVAEHLSSTCPWNVKRNRARLLGTYAKTLSVIKNISIDHPFRNNDAQILEVIEKCEKTVIEILDREEKQITTMTIEQEED
jgi:hypothetical protein